MLSLTGAHLVEHIGQGRRDRGQVVRQVFLVARRSLLLAGLVGRLHCLLPAGLALQQRLEGLQPQRSFLQPGPVESA